MSKELLLLNGFLRTIGKPSAKYMALNPQRLGFHRTAISRAAGLVAVPEHVRLAPQALGHFDAEWVQSVHAGDEPRPRIVLYIPGGAFSMGCPVTHRGITTRLARYARAQVLVLNYRKVPEHPYPGALEDAHHAWLWLLDQGYSPSDIMIAGDSAGGNLTLALMQRLRDQGLPLPAASLLFSPWADLACTGESMRFNRRVDTMVPYEHIADGASAYANGIALDDPRISPLFGDFSGLPPMLVHASDSEMLFSDATRLALWARDAGVEVELKTWRNAPHAFQLFSGFVPQGRESLKRAADFIFRVHGSQPVWQQRAGEREALAS